VTAANGLYIIIIKLIEIITRNSPDQYYETPSHKTEYLKLGSTAEHADTPSEAGSTHLFNTDGLQRAKQALGRSFALIT